MSELFCMLCDISIEHLEKGKVFFVHVEKLLKYNIDSF